MGLDVAVDQSNSGTNQVISVVAPYFIATGDDSILADATAGAYSVLLPLAASSNGRLLHVKKIDASANAVTVLGRPGDLVEDAASQPLTMQGENLMLICDGSGWRVL
jgi:hypothetical protein